MASEKKQPLGKVLVVGGNGFLGHHVVAQLVDEWDAKVTVVDLRCARNRRPDSDGVAYLEADITDEARLVEIFKTVRPDAVVHTASPAAQGDDAVAKALFKKVNVDGTQSVVNACREAGVKALVYTSSASIISDNKSDLINADERWPVIRGDQQTEYYSETKVREERRVIVPLLRNLNGPTNGLSSFPPHRPKPKRSSSRPTANPTRRSSPAPSVPRASSARGTP